MENLSPALKESVHSVHFTNDENLDVGSVQRKWQEGAADEENMRILIRVSSLNGHDFRENEFLHEAAHLLTYKLGTPFQKRWEAVAGNVYDRYVLLRDEKGGDGGWRNGESKKMAQFGCMTSYGSKNFKEDIATFAESATFEPGKIRNRIDPHSKFYWLHPDQKRYASVYRAKLELLREYGFITEEKYSEILPQKTKPLHPRVATFCAREAVNCP